MRRVTNHETRLPRVTSSLALYASRDGASTTSLGNMFQCVITPSENLPPNSWCVAVLWNWDENHVGNSYTLEHVAQGGCGCPIPGAIQGQAGCGSGQPGLVAGDPAHSKGVETQ